MPIRRRGNSSVPKCRMVSASPFCPPADPPDLIRSRANSRLKSSQTSNRSHNGEAEKVDDLPHRPAAFVHVRLRCGQQHLFAPSVASASRASKRRRAFPAPSRVANSSTTTNPTLCRVCSYFGPGFPRPTTTFTRQPSRDNLNAPVQSPVSRVSRTKQGRPSTLEPRNFEPWTISSLSFLPLPPRRSP